jgi:glycosyltransferase-like protein
MPFRDRLRIAILTYSTQPRGGVVHACSVAEALAELGHETVLFALDDAERDFARPPRCAYRRIPVRPEREGIVAFVRRRVAAYVEHFGAGNHAFDIYHAQDGISGNALATLVERGAIERFVRTVHHIDAFTDPELAALQERAIVAAAQCFVVSGLWMDRLRERYGIVAGFVPSGVDFARFAPISAPRRATLRRELRLGPGPVFLTIGGIEARKNTLGLLEAFALVRATLPGARLVIAGGASVFDHGAYRRAFDARRRELGLDSDDAIVITGVLPDLDIAALLGAADAFVFPSLVEGFGLVVLEALASGTPVVTSAIAPFTEYLADGDALLADPRDPGALAAAMLSSVASEVNARLRARGPHVARPYSWRASARAHVANYRASLESVPA